MDELSERGIKVDGLGGRLRSLSQSFVGPLTAVALERNSLRARGFIQAGPAAVPRVGPAGADLDFGSGRRRRPRPDAEVPDTRVRVEVGPAQFSGYPCPNQTRRPLPFQSAIASSLCFSGSVLNGLQPARAY
jgi:hypothetical protein